MHRIRLEASAQELLSPWSWGTPPSQHMAGFPKFRGSGIFLGGLFSDELNLQSLSQRTWVGTDWSKFLIVICPFQDWLPDPGADPESLHQNVTCSRHLRSTKGCRILCQTLNSPWKSQRSQVPASIRKQGQRSIMRTNDVLDSSRVQEIPRALEGRDRH